MKRGEKKRVLSFAGVDPVKLLGINDRNLKVIEDHFNQRIVVRGDDIIIRGPKKVVDELTVVLENLIQIAGTGRRVAERDVHTVLKSNGKKNQLITQLGDDVIYYSPGKRRSIVPRSVKQKEYVEAIRRNDVVFAIGPAGTGKTYLAVGMALSALKRKEIDRIFISRPVVEAGESLGFLPGDLSEKIDPYVRPIFDALSDMLGRERLQRMIESGIIEIAPLAYMRGRTLNNSFAILDEAQNSTVMQMKMFLTRLGVNSKAIITGDITQIDLSDTSKSGLVAVRKILGKIAGIKFVTFGKEDVVRHRLVKKIIEAFTLREASLKANREDGEKLEDRIKGNSNTGDLGGGKDSE